VRRARAPRGSDEPAGAPATAIEKVVDLDHPPGNIAVSAAGRVFFTLHPDGSPPAQVHELRDGTAVPYPSAAFADYQSVLALRIDRQNRLWALDYAKYGRGQPRLLAFDLATDREVHRYDVPSEVAGFLSMLNDFQVSPDGRTIYIAEASPIRQTPAIIVYDVVARTSRRLLDSHASLLPQGYVIQAPGRDMVVLGFYALHIGIDTIALDRTGEWLYYGPVNGPGSGASRRPRPRHDADDAALASRIGTSARAISDGASTDDAGNVYLTDFEHWRCWRSVRPRAHAVKDRMLRWPDGLSFGPDGWLYVTCSAFSTSFVSDATMRAHAVSDLLLPPCRRRRPVAPAVASRIGPAY
jgi:hypothetical protein